MNIKKFGRNAKVIWKDRKRWCGLPLTFTKYSIIEVPGRWIKLFEEKGFLHTHIEEVHLFRIDDFTVSQSLVNKLWGVGNIDVYFNDASHKSMRINRIKNVYGAYELLTKHVDRDKKDRNMRYTEFQR